MVNRNSKISSLGLTTAAILALTLGVCPRATLQEQPNGVSLVQTQAECTIDLAKPGHMKDILSNALQKGLKLPENDVASFLSGAEKKYANGPELLKATAAQFKLDETRLTAEVAKFKHVNCKHAGGGATTVAAQQNLPVSTFARNVTRHVVLHEIGHAIIREFDIPVLANEETTADAFATYYLTTYLPDIAVDVLTARVTSLMIEAGEETEVSWSGEHDHDARRAYQIAALAIAADPIKYKPVAAVVKMSENNIKSAEDYGGELRRSWRRVLAPLMLPTGTSSREARVVYDAKNDFLKQLCDGGLASEVEAILRRFDWHSQVTVSFIEGTGKAGWNRSSRTVTVHSNYVRRFIDQGRRGLPSSPK